MISLIVVSAFAIAVFGDKLNFTPRDPLGLINEERVWVHLNPKCFSTETEVRTFKDYLLSKYQCIDFNEERKVIYKHAVSANYSVWSLWLEKVDDLQCLDAVIDLPSNVVTACVDNVLFEPMETLDVWFDDLKNEGCAEQSAVVPFDLWSLDIMDGTKDERYIYPTYNAITDGTVEAIILDGGVRATHLEFFNNAPNNLFSGTPNSQMTLGHGTHVSGTVLGEEVGGSKNTKLNYYPVCQYGNSCAWSDIEGGYNTAISYMQGQSGKRFVINYSVGGGRGSTDTQYTVWGNAMINAGGIWVTSAGNSNTNACNASPAFALQAITVGAYDSDFNRAWFSNYGQTNNNCVDVWGPGVGVLSASGDSDGTYTAMSGTSMSSPNIAALVVNLLKSDNSLTLDEIKQYLLTNQRTVNIGGGYVPMNQAYLACSESEQ